MAVPVHGESQIKNKILVSYLETGIQGKFFPTIPTYKYYEILNLVHTSWIFILKKSVVCYD